MKMQRERNADYCRCLGTVITRYLAPDELQAYGEHLEAFVAQVTASRPAQGLHDASYHLRIRFKLPQPAQGKTLQGKRSGTWGCQCAAARKS